MRIVRLFCALSLLAPAAAQVKVTQGDNRVDVTINGEPYTSLYFGPETTKPYLHPLRSASGKIVTRMYPMEEKDGEVKDHIHHRGLWFSHGDVNGVDFWANDPSQQGPKKGKIVLKKLGPVRSGKTGSVEAVFEWVDFNGKALVRDERAYAFQAPGDLRIVDIDITLTGIEKAHFGDTKEGVFAIRLATEMDGKHTGRMESADGKIGEKEVWGRPSPWVDYYGKVDGELLGVAIFDHPSNPKHPTHWHSRDYGLFAANVFGERDFYRDKTRDGGVTLEPGQSMRFRYRVVVHPGDAKTARIADLYGEYITNSR
jgi:hypothetical protein